MELFTRATPEEPNEGSINLMSTGPSNNEILVIFSKDLTNIYRLDISVLATTGIYTCDEKFYIRSMVLINKNDVLVTVISRKDGMLCYKFMLWNHD